MWINWSNISNKLMLIKLQTCLVANVEIRKLTRVKLQTIIENRGLVKQCYFVKLRT